MVSVTLICDVCLLISCLEHILLIFLWHIAEGHTFLSLAASSSPYSFSG